MIRSIACLISLAALSASAAAAPTSEALRAGAGLGFSNALLPAGWGEKLKVVGRVPAGVLPGADGFTAFLKEHTAVLGAAASVAGDRAPDQEVELAPALNRHLKTELEFTLSGKKVWVSGAFDRQQSAFVSFLVEGESPRFFNVKGLLDKEETMVIGGATYKVSLSPNIIDQLQSEIVIKNAANRRDREQVTIKEMLDAVKNAGFAVKPGPQVYSAFYYNDIKNGAMDPDSRSFCFVMTDAKGEIHVYLVPAELVPADKIAIFKMWEDRPIGLRQASGKLQVFDKP